MTHLVSGSSPSQQEDSPYVSPKEVDTEKQIKSLKRSIWCYRGFLLFIVITAICQHFTLLDANKVMQDMKTPDAQWKQSIVDAEAFIERPNPQLPAFGYVNRAYARAQMRDYEGAKADLAKTREIEKNYSRHQHYAFTVFAIAKAGFTADAADLLDQMLKDNPADHNASITCASFYAHCGNAAYRDTKRAVGLMQKALAMKGQKTDKYDVFLLANILAADGRVDDAIREAERAMKMPSPAATKPAVQEKMDAMMMEFITSLKNGTFKPNLSY